MKTRLVFAWTFAFIVCGLTQRPGSIGAEPQTSSVTTTRAAFLKLIERPKVPLMPEVRELPQVNGFRQTHFTFASDAHQRVPGILIKESSDDRRQVIISLHGTGGTKESQIALLTNVAARGFVGIAVDGRYHGERTQQGRGTAAYHDAILRAYQTGEEHPLLTCGPSLRSGGEPLSN